MIKTDVPDVRHATISDTSGSPTTGEPLLAVEGLSARYRTEHEAIEAVRHRADVSELTPDERDIVTFVRQLLQTNRVEQGLFDALRDRHSVRWLVELAATVGQYQYISAINNAFDVQAAADADQLPV